MLRPKTMIPVFFFLLGFQALGFGAQAPQKIQKFAFDVVPAPFFIQEGGVLKQMMTVRFENPGGEIKADLRTRIGSEEGRTALRPIPSGRSEQAIYLPEIKNPTTAKFILRAGDKTLELEKTLQSGRKWTIYLFHHSHTDIGYTDLQTRISKKHAEYLDSVIQYYRETENYPDDAKFRWNIEVAWGVENYIKQRPEAKVKELLDLVKKGRVEVGAWYVQLSDMFSHEELVRATYPARELSRKYGIAISSAMNNDVTGFSWATPLILSQAGVRYFATGINEDRARAPLRRPCAFYWESPDGSRILHWNGEHYLFANYGLRLHEGQAKSQPEVEKYLTGLEGRGDYPYELIAFNISAYVTDNCPPGRELSDMVRDWNARWAYPKMRLATMPEFFRALEKKYAGQIPTYKLGWPDYWTDGVASAAYETGLNRLTHNDLLTAEKLATIAASVNPQFVYPAAEIKEAYSQSMLYDEHTWGAANSISDPDSETARGQWALKSSFAYIASEISQSLLGQGLKAIAHEIPKTDTFSFAVFNPLSWERTDMAKVALIDSLIEKKGNFRLIDKRTGREEVFQVLDERTILLEAHDIPGFGYAVYSVIPDKAPVRAEVRISVGRNSIENDFYRLALDPVTGGIKSIYDKEAKIECVDSGSPYKLNQYIYENPEGGRKAVDNREKRAIFVRASPTSAKISPGLQGALTSSLKMQTSAPGCHDIESEIFLYKDVKRIDIVNRLRKKEALEPEAVYFAFPFKVEGRKFVFEIADGMMRPEIEQLPGTTRDWHTVQHWVEVSSPSRSLVWSPVQAPLVQFCDINTGKWLKKLEITNSSLFSYAMNNYWYTNFKASQGGLMRFRYALTTRAGGSDPVKSSLFGWENHTPLRTAWIPGTDKGTLSGTSAYFFRVDKSQVILQSVKKPEEGEGLILRLREIAGKDTEVRVKSPLFWPGKTVAVLTDIGEKDEKSAAVSGDEVIVPIKAFGIQTVRIMRAK
jgi:alpha-mannosidase